MAQHALVLGHGQSVGSDSIHGPTAAGSSDTVLQGAHSLRSQAPESSCFAPRASVIQKQGFSDEVEQELRLLRDSLPEPSTNQSGPILYRMAIADMVGNDRLSISKDENLIRLLDSFHRDKTKGRRGVPTWNLSLVLHQLTKAPFEPMQSLF